MMSCKKILLLLFLFLIVSVAVYAKPLLYMEYGIAINPIVKIAWDINRWKLETGLGAGLYTPAPFLVYLSAGYNVIERKSFQWGLLISGSCGFIPNKECILGVNLIQSRFNFLFGKNANNGLTINLPIPIYGDHNLTIGYVHKF